MSKSNLDYPNNICVRARNNSESLKWVGFFLGGGGERERGVSSFGAPCVSLKLLSCF